MTLAEKILQKHIHHFKNGEEKAVLAAMKEACEMAFEAGKDHEYAESFGIVPNRWPNKTEFLNSLFSKEDESPN